MYKMPRGRFLHHGFWVLLDISTAGPIESINAREAFCKSAQSSGRTKTSTATSTLKLPHRLHLQGFARARVLRSRDLGIQPQKPRP